VSKQNFDHIVSRAVLKLKHFQEAQTKRSCDFLDMQLKWSHDKYTQNVRFGVLMAR
jgi:hypothetical protein